MPKDYRILIEKMCGYCIMGNHWHRMVNNLSTLDEDITAKIEKSIDRGSPLGDDDWIVKAAGDLCLESTIRPRGRPRKEG